MSLQKDFFMNYLMGLFNEWFVKVKAVKFLGGEKDKVYDDYLKIQVEKTIRKKNKDASFRYEVLIRELLKNIDIEKKDVLCVGCRNSFELDAFEAAGFSEVKGIDIWSDDSRVSVMDMGKMMFDDNSFNVLYSGDSLEHSYNVNQAISEFCRVVRLGGFIVIAMPINYSTNNIDRWDFKNVENLRKEFEKNVDEALVVWQEITEASVKVIFKLKK